MIWHGIELVCHGSNSPRPAWHGVAVRNGCDIAVRVERVSGGWEATVDIDMEAPDAPGYYTAQLMLKGCTSADDATEFDALGLLDARFLELVGVLS